MSYEYVGNAQPVEILAKLLWVGPVEIVSCTCLIQ